MTASPVQVCVRCRKPLAEGARKDRFGNAYCHDCANAMIAALERVRQRGAQPQGVAAATATVPAPRRAPERPVAPSPLTPKVTITADAIPLADSPAPGSDAPPMPPTRRTIAVPTRPIAPPDADGILPVEPEAEVAKPRLRLCESCSKSINDEVYVCPYCHYDSRLGSPASLKAPLHACSNCGYDLAGLPDPPICPECGTQNVRASPRALEYRQASAEVVRRAYRRPAIMLGVGLFGLMLLMAIEYAFGKASLVQALFIPAKYLVEVPVGLAVYIVCCFSWIGFDMPLRLVAFRLAAIYAVVDLIDTAGSLLGVFSIIVWPIVLITYIGLLMEELDLEFQDAVVLAFLAAVMKAIVTAVLVWVATSFHLI